MTIGIEYQKHYYPGVRQALVQKVQAAMSDYRYQHVLRVEAMALQLAEIWGVDLEMASVAALVHDYTKERSDDDFKAMIATAHLDADLLNWGNNIWHGVVGAEFIARELNITDETILTAVRQHTTGAPEMTPLSQVLYMADYVEMGRDFPGVDEVRNLAHTNLAASVGWQAQHTLAYLVGQKARIYPLSLLTYNVWSTK